MVPPLCRLVGRSRRVQILQIGLGIAMKNFVKYNKFVLIAAFLEGLPSKVSKKFFDAAEFGNSSYYSSSF